MPSCLHMTLLAPGAVLNQAPLAGLNLNSALNQPETPGAAAAPADAEESVGAERRLVVAAGKARGSLMVWCGEPVLGAEQLEERLASAATAGTSGRWVGFWHEGQGLVRGTGAGAQAWASPYMSASQSSTC